VALTTRHSRWLPAPWPYVFNKSGIPLVPLDLVYAFAVPIAEMFYYALADKREAVRRNYARITGRDEHDPVVERMTRQCFRHFGRYVAEFIHVQSWDHDAFFAYVDRWMDPTGDAAYTQTIFDMTGWDYRGAWAAQGQAWDALVEEMWAAHR